MTNQYLIQLISGFNALLPRWQQAMDRKNKTHAALIEWRRSVDICSTIQVDDNTQFNAITGRDRGIDWICNHLESIANVAGWTEERDNALEDAIERLTAKCDALSAHKPVTDYWEAMERENDIYWEIIGIENQILEFPAIERADVISKAKFIAERQWTEDWPENSEVFEQLLVSFNLVKAAVSNA